jgi:hypothetical protein
MVSRCHCNGADSIEWGFLVTEEPDEIRLTLRMPKKLRDQLTSLAADNGRSLNAEMVHRLEQAVASADTVMLLEEQLGELWRKFEELERRVWEHDEMLRPGRYDRD